MTRPDTVMVRNLFNVDQNRVASGELRDRDLALDKRPPDPAASSILRNTGLDLLSIL